MIVALEFFSWAFCGLVFCRLLLFPFLEIFAVWMRILKRCPNSVLWLLKFPEAGRAKIHSHAEAHGVPRERVVFTDVAVKDVC